MDRREGSRGTCGKWKEGKEVEAWNACIVNSMRTPVSVGFG